MLPIFTAEQVCWWYWTINHIWLLCLAPTSNNFELDCHKLYYLTKNSADDIYQLWFFAISPVIPTHKQPFTRGFLQIDFINKQLANIFSPMIISDVWKLLYFQRKELQLGRMRPCRAATLTLVKIEMYKKFRRPSGYQPLDLEHFGALNGGDSCDE